MGWKTKSLGGAILIGIVGFASKLGEIAGVIKTGIATHAGGSATAAAAIETGFTGAGNFFGILMHYANIASNAVWGGLIHAVGGTTSVAAGLGLGVLALDAALVVGACYAVGKLFQWGWRKLHPKPETQEHGMIPQQGPPSMGRGMRRDNPSRDYDIDSPSPTPPGAAQVIAPRGQTQQARGY